MRAPGHVGGPAALVVLALLALPAIFGAPVVDVAIGAGYHVIWVIVPGVLAYRALSPSAGSILRQLAVGWALGYALEILAFAGSAELGARGLLYAYPAAVALLTTWVIRARGGTAHTGAAGGGLTGAQAWTLAGAIALFLLWVALAHFTLAPLPGGERTVLYHPDHPYHMSIAADALHHWPLKDAEMANEPRAYHVFAHLHVAAMAQVTGIDVPVVYLRLYLLPMLVLLGLQLAWAGRALTGNTWVGLAAAGLLLFVGEFDLDPRVEYTLIPFSGLFFTDLYDSPSFVLGLVFFLPAVLLILERLEARRALSAPGTWAMVLILLAGCAGAKVSIPPVMAGALALYALWQLVSRRRIGVPTLLAGGATALVAALFYLLQYQGHKSGTSIDPFAAVDSMTGVVAIKAWLGGAPGPLGEDLLLGPVGAAIGLVALLGAPLVGIVPLLVRRGRALEPRHVWLLALLGSGLTGFILIDPNGAFFLFYGYVAGVLLSAEGLVDLLSQVPRDRLRRLAPVVTGWLALLLAAGVLPLLVFDPLGAKENGALYVGWLAALIAGLVAIWRTGRRGGLGGIGASALLSVAVVAVGVLDAPLDHGLRLATGDRPLYERFFPRGMTPGLYDGLLWIRTNTGTGAELAVNRHLSKQRTRIYLSRYYYYSAFAERRVFYEDWDFAVRTSDTAPEPPFRERLDLQRAVFEAADPWAIRALAEGAGVTHLVVDLHSDPVSPRLGERTRLVHATPGARIYSIARRAPTLVAAGGREELIDPVGRRIPVEPGAVGGAIEGLRPDDGRVEVAGWSATERGPAERLLVFVDGHLVAAPVPSLDRPDVARVLGAAALGAGFTALVPSAARIENPTVADVRVFGMRDGRASELELISTR